MKFFAGLLVFAVAIILVFWWLGQQTASPPPVAVQPTPAQPSRPQPAPMAQPSAGGAPAAPQPSRRAAADRAAAEARVTISSWRETPGEAIVEIRWTTDNAAQGGDFLDALMRAGVLRDFDELGKGQMMSNNRRTFMATFRLKFK
jgi:hypothetical protein